ncbi:MAG: GNAT family N-acetyltransferase [Candidatus Azotimanducaceae bacterium WSBS_2022_MAG_OTU7]
MSNKVDVPSINTDNYLLSPLTIGHSEGMYKLWSSEEVCHYSGDADDFWGNPIPMPVNSPEESDKIIEFFSLHQKETGKGFRWAILSKDTKSFFGALGFNSLGPCSELAYHLNPDYWGRGIMTEACLAAIEWAKTAQNSVEIEAYIDPENIKSIALVERLKFKQVGDVRDGAARFMLAIQEE